ncbi:PHP domain-containing protein [Halomicroarcula sp. F13]|uniref:PHP domain-containing protein n=1 Tax=Haloarcula rubra TaxID=2487747 RepID=A0AAW4PXR5_9EURY|nr:PHP-associated domain-containing protein [Halomicroarcula rubra]MBX0325971.1 PHP domain-containing protein [Halomicroarcula rubra]
MFDCDLHTHSRFFHRKPEVASWYDPYGVRATLRVAMFRGLDGIAVTNHDFYRPDTNVSDACIPGIEISTTQGHLLVVGPDPPTVTEPGELTPHEAVALAHDRDCVAIVAHPFRNSTLRESDADFDAIEINGKHPEYRRRIEAIARNRGLPLVGGSDAHFPFEAGRLSTRLEIEQLTPEAVVRAVRDGRVEPVFRDGPLFETLGSLYSRIHGVKGHTTTDDVSEEHPDR